VWSTPTIYPNDTFDFDMNVRFKRLAGVLAPVLFARIVLKYRVIICGFDGFVLGVTVLKRIEPYLLKLARCKIFVVPYGGDAYQYSNVRSEALQHALQVSYPARARQQKSIAADVSRMVRLADFVMPGLMGFDGIGRWDVLTPNPLTIDINLWQPARLADGRESVVVAHSPNHRGFKGSEFLIAAVDRLRSEGLAVDLLLLEQVPNEEIRRVLTEQADILVEQLIFPGYAMSGVEGLAAGVVVISNLADERILQPFRRWSFLSQCPIVSATPETIENVLRELCSNPSRRREIALKSRQYAVDYHSRDVFADFYAEAESFMFGERGSLINYFHPLLGEYKPKGVES
jgi:glycosyltransferase involved in cell wall biosynthesis